MKKLVAFNVVGAVTLFFFSAVCVIACKGDTNLTEREIRVPTPDDEEEEDYEYDYDLDYDPAEYLSSYGGTAYKNHVISAASISVIQAEDFDEGGEGISYHDTTEGRGGNSETNAYDNVYRSLSTGKDVDIREKDKTYYIGDTGGGEWLCYTLDVEQDGAYLIETYCVRGNEGDSKFYLYVDGRMATRVLNAPLNIGNWTDFSKCVKAEDIQLTQGKHVLKWYSVDAMNLDRFELQRTGDLKDWTADFHYPIMKNMRNPLFVDFPSPMFESYLTGNLYTADPSARVWTIDGKEILYVYASHDMEPKKGCDRMDRYHVFSTEDMQNWTDHGEILCSKVVKEQAGWGIDGFMWAPDCAYNPANQTYYFYFPHPVDPNNRENTWRIGVATSKYPDKNFRVVGFVEGMPSKIDPCVFVDDDGQPYIYNGGGGKCYGAKLDKDDWTKLGGEVKEMTGMADFHEAAWIHKYDGKYYLSHSDNNSVKKGGNRMKYAVSDSPLGPWIDKGVYMYPTGAETNHGSIVKFKGVWYVFYHAEHYSGEGALRSVCVDPVQINSDGSLNIVRNWGTPRGGLLPSVGANNSSLTIQAENFNEGGYHYAYFRKSRTTMPVVTVKDGRTCVTDLEKGEWVRYSFRVETDGVYAVDCMLRSERGNSKFLVSMNGIHAESEGIVVEAGTTAEPWKVTTVRSINLAAGEYYLEFRVVSGNVSVASFVVRKQ